MEQRCNGTKRSIGRKRGVTTVHVAEERDNGFYRVLHQHCNHACIYIYIGKECPTSIHNVEQQLILRRSLGISVKGPSVTAGHLQHETAQPMLIWKVLNAFKIELFYVVGQYLQPFRWLKCSWYIHVFK